MADSLTPITSNQLSKVTTAKDTGLVTLGINGDFVVMTLANLKEVLGINALNTKTTGIKRIVAKNLVVNTQGNTAWAVSSLADIFGAESGANSTNCVVVATNMDQTANAVRIVSTATRANGQVLIYTDPATDSPIRIGLIAVMIGS